MKELIKVIAFDADDTLWSNYGAQYKMWHGQNVGRST